MEDDLHSVEEDLWWKTTFGGGSTKFEEALEGLEGNEVREGPGESRRVGRVQEVKNVPDPH